MKITLITVGKIKEKYLKDAIAEYSKRLNGITFFPQKPPYLLTIPIYWEIKLYRLQRLL